MEQPVVGSGNGTPAANTPKTPPSPAVRFSDPPHSMNAGAPSLPDTADEESGESPEVELKESQQL